MHGGGWLPAVVVADRAGDGHGHGARLDAQKRVEDPDQQPASRRVADGVRARPGPELHQTGRTEEPAEGTGRDVHHAGGHHHQHGAVPPAAAHRAPDTGPPAAPEPHGRPGAAVQVVRHARLHQRTVVGHSRTAAQLQDQENEHIQKLRHPAHHRHETTDAHAHRSVKRSVFRLHSDIKIKNTQQPVEVNPSSRRQDSVLLLYTN